MRAAEHSLSNWLAHMEGLNSNAIDLGLDRMRQVGAALDVLKPAPLSVVIAGTNGKGSTAVCLEQVLLATKRRVGCTLSPHLHSFRERVRLNGVEADQAVLRQAFAAVEAARGCLPLTYFEFSCLAALYCFKAAAVDIAILEIGLGGRLDAFNVVDADVAVITSIGLDHMEYLGQTLEAIGAEKAGVFRLGQQVVLGDDMPQSVLAAAARSAAKPMRLGRDIRLHADDGQSWRLEVGQCALRALPDPRLPRSNCALAVAASVAVDGASGEDRIDEASVRRGLSSAWLPGRLERIAAWSRQWLVDVAHNPLGARFLNREIPARFPVVAATSSLVAVFGNLVDKDSEGIFKALRGLVRHWVLVDTTGERGLSARDLAVRGAPADHSLAGELHDGLMLARSLAEASDVILVFGSFAVAGAARSKLMAL